MNARLTHLSARAAYWSAPSIFCLILYWNGLQSWFQQDDFAWLGLHLMVQDWGSFWQAMFEPMAQGTIRPWSERLFFMSFQTMFGMEALPYRIAVFATQFANLILLAAIVRQVTGSAPAGFFAPLLWTANSGLHVPLSWTSAYNQILCSFFLLLAFYLFVRYTQTGDKRFYWGQWIAFVLGFGALELNVVYPALAALYALCCARKYFRGTLPMFAVSGLYAAAHRLHTSANESEVYRMHVDESMLSTLATYVRWALGADRLARTEFLAVWPFLLMEVIVLLALIGFVAWKVRRREWLALFFVGWFLIVLAPLLPLKNHISDYYLTMPSIGLAMLGGWAVAVAWRSGAPAAAAACVVALLYAVPSAWLSWCGTDYAYYQSHRVKAFVQRVAHAHKLHPDKIILLRGLDTELFWNAFYADPFRIFGLRRIYLTAETEPFIEPLPDAGSISQYFLADAVAKRALNRKQAVVYERNGDRLRNITMIFSSLLSVRSNPGLPKWVDVGRPVFEGQLGEGWYQIEDRGFRWMGKRAELTMGRPASEECKLLVSGFVAIPQLEDGPLHLTVSVDGMRFPPERIDASNQEFTFSYGLPRRTAGKTSVEIALEVDRTLSIPNDRRKLGLALGTFSIVQ